MSPPSLDQDPGLGERVEDLAIEQFIAQRPVEALAVSILPWRSGGDVERLHADLRQPFLHRRRDKFRAIVGPDMRGRTARDEQLSQRRQHRSEEHTSELQSLMRISYAVFCLKKTNNPYATKP